jgi:hypothetical protein
MGTTSARRVEEKGGPGVFHLHLSGPIGLVPFPGVLRLRNPRRSPGKRGGSFLQQRNGNGHARMSKILGKTHKLSTQPPTPLASFVQAFFE